MQILNILLYCQLRLCFIGSSLGVLKISNIYYHVVLQEKPLILIFRRKVSRCFDVISIKMSVCWYWWELFAFRFFIQKLSIIFLSPLYMRKTWPYLEFFRSVYPRILTELGEILRIPRWDAPYLSVFNLNEGKCGPEELRIRTLFTQWSTLRTFKNSSEGLKGIQ